MISMAKPGTVTSAGGKQTIVIAAPKSGISGSTPTKIITTVPKMAQAQGGGSGTQYIVVNTRPGGTGGITQSTMSKMGTQIIGTAGSAVGGKPIITIVTTASAMHRAGGMYIFFFFVL